MKRAAATPIAVTPASSTSRPREPRPLTVHLELAETDDPELKDRVVNALADFLAGRPARLG